jgi:hypothetical protein
MASSLFAATRRLLRFGCGRSRLLTGLVPRAADAYPCRYSTDNPRPARALGLQSTLYPLGHPGTLLVPEIELWAARPGNRLRPVELQRIVKELRKRRRHRQALEVQLCLLFFFGLVGAWNWKLFDEMRWNGRSFWMKTYIILSSSVVHHWLVWTSAYEVC